MKRRRPRIMFVAGGVVLGAAVLASPASTSVLTGPKRCVIAGRATVAANSRVRVFRTGNGTFACRLPSGRPQPLGDQDQYPDVVTARRVHVAGAFVGYELAAARRSGSGSSVNVRNVVTGRLVRAVASTDRAGNPPAAGSGSVLDLYVTATGDIAWIVTNPQGITELRKADTAGTSVVSSGAIDRSSLGGSGEVVYWVQEGTARLVTLT